MRIRLTTNIDESPEHGCLAGKEFDAIFIRPRSTTVEFTGDSGKRFRAFHYEYEMVETEEQAEA